jgi:hypothetical protein
MEHILDLYTLPHQPQRPLVCFDETNKQLIGETRTPVAPRPGRVTRYDYEYTREGTCNLFMFFAPLEGWRQVKVTARRTTQDFARCMQELVEVYFPQAERIRVVLDNLNTHTPWALYETFPAAQAKRLVDRLEFHYTPKHGSWLNVAEIELSILNGQCLDRRIPDPGTLETEVTAWAQARNARAAKVHWRFTTADARIKLKRLYPVIE